MPPDGCGKGAGMSNYNVIGSRARRVDGPAKATGQAVYTDDITVQGMLHGAILHSTQAHAWIKNIDTSAAKALPGVRAVITAADVPDTKYGVSPARYDENVFAIDKVRYVGDEVAAVAAIDLETAQEALTLIKVDYEPIPAIFTIEEAMAEDGPQLHEEYPLNICGEVHQEFGDFDKAIKDCDLVVTHTFLNKRQDAAYMEPCSSLAEFDERGYLKLTSSTQSVHYTQRTVAMVLGMPVGKVRVVKPYVGGGFGPKAQATPLDLIAPLLARAAGAPVKITHSRAENFLYSRARHQFKSEYTIGAMKDGTLVGLHNKTWMEGGAYSSFGIATVYYAGSLLGGPYKLQHMKYDGYRYYTNRPPCGAQRGHGGVAARAHFEQQLDMIAEELKIDPIELRLKNMMQTGDTTVNQLNMSSLGMQECVEAVKEGSGWDEKKGKLPPGKGIGMACGFFVSGAGYPIYRSDTYHATVVIQLSEDGGTALVKSGAAEIGQGSDTTWAMIAAEGLGIDYNDVRVISGDTDYSVDLGAYSSRQTLMTGHATKEAAEDAKRQVLEVLSEMTGTPVEEMDVKAGKIVFSGEVPDIKEIRTIYVKEHRGWSDWPEGDDLTFREAARMAYLKRGSIVGTGKYKPPKLGGAYKGAAVGTSPAYGCSAQVVEVSVDLETGEVTVEAVNDAHDCGQAINRTSVEAQMEGSVSMGVGEALFEEVKFDDQGNCLTASLGEYKIPTALDMPDCNAIVIETNEPNGPFGAKEVGEGAIMPTIPAVLNAIYDATGVRVNELPCSAERIVLGLAEKENE